jgi:hypothetical protein
MKKVLIVLFIFTFSISLHAQNKYHIWASTNNEDFSWQNDLVKELRNSKYHNLIGNYQESFDYSGIKNFDYIIDIQTIFIHENASCFGVVVYMQYREIEGKQILSYLSRFSFNHTISKKQDGINGIRNKIFQWIELY